MIAAGKGEFKPFQNFHARTSSGDTKLRKALKGTALEGAFLTDLVKDYGTKYADGLKAKIRAGALDIEHHVRAGFTAEQEVLGLGPETLYIPFGGRTRELWDLLVDRGAIPAAQRVFHAEYRSGPLFQGRAVHNLARYSGAVNMTQAVGALLAQPSAK